MVTIDSGRKDSIWIWYITPVEDEVRILESIEDISSIDGRDVFFNDSVRGKQIHIARSNRMTLKFLNNLDKRIRAKFEKDGIEVYDSTGIVTSGQIPSKFRPL